MNALVPLKGFTGAETVATLTDAKRLLNSGIGTDLQRFSVFYALWASNLFAAKMEPALTLAIQFVEVAERNDDTVYRLIGYRLIGTMQAYMGRNREAGERPARRGVPRSPPAKGFHLPVWSRSGPRCSLAQAAAPYLAGST